MNEEIYYVITFDSTHHAIKGEKILKNAGLEIRTIPTPREISASCGLSIKFGTEDLEQVKEEISGSSLAINGLYQITKNKLEKKLKRIN